MLRVLALLGLIVVVALPHRALAKVLRGGKTVAAGLSQRSQAPSAPASRGPGEPVEVDDEGGDADSDADPVNVGAVLAAMLSPKQPRVAVERPSGTSAGVLWSLATQECGPPSLG